MWRPLRGEFLETFYRQAVDPNILPSVEPSPCVFTEKNVRSGFGYLDYLSTLNIDEPLARVESLGFVRYYQKDGLGSVIALADETGNIKTQYVYDPFGNTNISGEASDNPFQYTGRENDLSAVAQAGGTGLYYYRARYYSPELQRFISEDPIKFEGGDVNFYAYVQNNPINFIDPLGKQYLDEWPSDIPSPWKDIQNFWYYSIERVKGISQVTAEHLVDVLIDLLTRAKSLELIFIKESLEETLKLFFPQPTEACPKK